MKPFRHFLFGLGILAGLLLVAVLLAFTPAVQTWAVRRVLADQPGLEAEVGRVAAGLGTIRVENLRLRREGFDWTLPWVEVDLPVIPALLGRRVEITRLAAKGWSINLAGTAPVASVSGRAAPMQAGFLGFLAAVQAPSNPGPRTFDGVFSRLSLPVDLALSGADLEGEVRFARAPGQSPARARISFVGGGLAPGHTGRFLLSSEIRADDPASPLLQVVARQEILVRMDAPRSLDRIEITGAATASGPQFPNGVRVDVETLASRVGRVESYGFTLKSGNRVLLGITGELPEEATAITGTWSLDARSDDLAPFALGRAIPDFTSAGSGTFSVNRSLGELQTAGTIAATAQKLELVDSRLRSVGRVRMESGFDLVARDADVRLNRLDVALSTDRPLLAITLLQGVEFSRSSGEVRVADIASDLLRLEVNGLPLAWAQAMWGENLVSGGDVRGGFIARVRSGRLMLRPTEPLSVMDIRVTRAGKTLVEDLDIATRVTLDYAPAGWQAEVTSLSLSQGGAPVAEIDLKAVQAAGAGNAVKVAGHYRVELPALLRQPMLSHYSGLRQGRASGEFTASLAGVQEIAASLTLEDLQVNSDAHLPVVKLDLRADRHADGTITARLPAVFTLEGRVSDLALSAAIAPRGEGLQVTAGLTGGQVFLEDVQLLAALIGTGESSGAQPAPPDGPPWVGITGRVNLDLKKVIFSPSFTAGAVTGALVIGPEAIIFENLSAGLPDGAGLKLSGDLAYDVRRARAYGLRADLTVSNFDPVPVFRGINPTALPLIEGRFEVASRLTSQAAEIDGLAEAAMGTFKLSSRGGVLRALTVDASEFARSGSRIASVAGLLSLATGDTRALKFADRLRAASELAQGLSAVTFDQLTLDLERGEGNDLLIKDLSLISPTLRLLGSGRIHHEPGVEIWHQPLAIQIQLGARDKLAENLRTLKLTGDRTDSLGYAPLLENIQIDGTLSAMGTAMLKDRLLQALAGQ